MADVQELLRVNRAHAIAPPAAPDPRPRRRMVVVTCMDVRIDLTAAFGIEPHDAQVVRNAGGRVTDDTLRSLAVSCNLLGVDTIVVIHHTGCMLATFDEGELRARTGAAFTFGAIGDHAAALQADVELLAATPYLGNVEVIAGLLYDVDTGKAELVTDWRRDS